MAALKPLTSFSVLSRHFSLRCCRTAFSYFFAYAVQVALADRPPFALSLRAKAGDISSSVEANPVVTLDFITNEQLDKYRAKYTTGGTPKFYTIVGQELEVLPVPDTATLTGEITYYSKIPALSGTNATNWLLNSSPDIYLYGTLMQSAPYLVDDARLPIWASIYQKLVGDLAIADQKARVGDSTLTIKATALQ